MVGKIVSNKAGFPNVSPSGIRGLLTLHITKAQPFFVGVDRIPFPLFAPSLMPLAYPKLINYLDIQDVGTGLQVGILNIQGQYPETAGVFPPTDMSYNYVDAGGTPEIAVQFNFKELAYMEVQQMLLGGDLLRITNIRLRYQLKVQSAAMRKQIITFFDQDIFGRPDFQQLTIGQYFDPVTNKTSNQDISPTETIDIPVDFFASNTSGLCINLDPNTNMNLNTLTATFQVEKYFNHVKQNKNSIL